MYTRTHTHTHKRFTGRTHIFRWSQSFGVAWQHNLILPLGSTCFQHSHTLYLWTSHRSCWVSSCCLVSCQQGNGLKTHTWILTATDKVISYHVSSGREEDTQPCYSPTVSSMSACLKKWMVSRLWSPAHQGRKGREGEKNQSKNSSIHRAMQESWKILACPLVNPKQELQSLAPHSPGLVSFGNPTVQLREIKKHSSCKGADTAERNAFQARKLWIEHSNMLKHSTPKHSSLAGPRELPTVHQREARACNPLQPQCPQDG